MKKGFPLLLLLVCTVSFVSCGGGGGGGGGAVGGGPAAASAPEAPSNLTATAVSGGVINLAWTDNADNETGFIVERHTDIVIDPIAVATLGPDVQAYADTGLSPGTRYYYRVKAYNAAGTSGPCTGNGTTRSLPAITGVIPPRLRLAECTSLPIVIYGSNFEATSIPFLVYPGDVSCPDSSTRIVADGDTLCSIDGSVTNGSGTEITATFSTCPVPHPYQLRVQNPSGDLSQEWAFITITSSAGGDLNNGAFAELSGLSEHLLAPRWKHGAAYGFDHRSRPHIYVAGGQGAARIVLASVESTAVDLYGNLEGFEASVQYFGSNDPRASNTLQKARQGHTLVRAKDYLYAIGGAASPTDTTTTVSAMKSVERARILGTAEMPTISSMSASGSTGLPTAWGGLPVAWHYRVSALGSWGEGVPSDDVAISEGGQISVCWNPPQASGVAGYNIYRAQETIGAFGTNHVFPAVLIAENVTGPCYIDNGLQKPFPPTFALAPGAGFPFAGGSGISSVSYRISALVGGQETPPSDSISCIILDTDANRAVQLTWQAFPGATGYSIYRQHPVTTLFERLGAVAGTSYIDDNGPIQLPPAQPRTVIAPLTPGSLSRWEELPSSQFLNSAREGADSIAIALDPASTGGLAARIFAVGGRSDNTSGGSTLGTAESIGVYADGTLESAWTVETPALTTPRAYLSLVTTVGADVTPSPLAQDTIGGGPGSYVLAVFGENSSGSPLADFEACGLSAAGHLSCDALWTVQGYVDSRGGGFGADAVLLFDYLFPFYGVSSETPAPGGSAITLLAPLSPYKYSLSSPVTAYQLLDVRSLSSTSFTTVRAYYQMLRLMGYVYAVGGWTSTGPTGTIERHAQ